ncbi:hypothetical protein AGLY_015446 [Aphis glycines]|uniref:DUF4371 domain-containing protein n=1 Tax=Aphis glycines TaxID=307491 RepID=A0A6G0T2D2_APHGL|nr:hypothetical protein AGLY_015446 [Aphis glycines]
MTLFANSWPSRSLSKIHSNAQIATYHEHGLDSNFVSFNPSKAVLHYKDPNIYRGKLDIIAEIVMKSVSEELKKSICFSIQIDGSVDKYSVDNKFITARYLDETNAIKNVFLENISNEKLLGLTTDGESANTGKKSGLWVRCDLAFSDIESMVTEVKHWKINIKSVATFYRGSAIRTDELKTISEKEGVKFYRFPQHFEVRFVEHLILLCESVWKNMPSMRKHWNNIVLADEETSNKKEKAIVRGFLKLWKEDGDQLFYTALMMDVLRLFKRFQKDGQKSMVTLCDIETSKNIAISSLELMETDYYPGGKKEELKKMLDDQISDNSDEINYDDKITKNQRKVPNAYEYVSTKRSVTSVRTEIVKSAKEFLSNRLADDQSSIIQRFKTFLNARNAQDTINAIRCDIEGIFGNENVSTFCDEVIGLYATDKLPCLINSIDPTVLRHFLQN